MRSGVPHRLTAVFLCLFLVTLPVWADTSTSAGQVAAVTPAAARNSRPLRVDEEIHWNDVLHTDRAGRTRVILRDGSILSLGSNSELKIVEHEPSSQQTILQLAAGRMRSRVVAITQAGGKFEVRTPAATARVLGTDFFVEYVPAGNTFRLICYSGTVQVSGNGDWAGHGETVRAGQMLTINANAFGNPQATSNAVQQDSIAQTTSESSPRASGDTHLLRNVLIGAAVAAAGVVVGLATTGSSGAAASQTGSQGDKKTH